MTNPPEKAETDHKPGDLDETKRVMARLASTPHKSHAPLGLRQQVIQPKKKAKKMPPKPKRKSTRA